MESLAGLHGGRDAGGLSGRSGSALAITLIYPIKGLILAMQKIHLHSLPETQRLPPRSQPHPAHAVIT
jgi:hypothetical protein